MAEYIEREAVLNILASKNAPWDGYQKVSELPIADVQPVKNGLWSGYSCSNCGISKYNFISFNIVGEKEYARPFGTWNYCPRCGAKMDGDNNG